MGIVADCCSLLQKLEDKTVHKNMVILYLNMVLSVTVQSACNIGVDSISRWIRDIMETLFSEEILVRLNWRGVNVNNQ